MLASELKKKLEDIPDDSYVYLDDHAMPTPLALVNVEFDVCDGYTIVRDQEGRSSIEKIKLRVVTLTTYIEPAAGWAADESIRNAKKKKKSKKKK